MRYASRKTPPSLLAVSKGRAFVRMIRDTAQQHFRMGRCFAWIGSVKRSLILDKSFLSSLGASRKGRKLGL
jgi:hypothetical protein